MSEEVQKPWWKEYRSLIAWVVVSLTMAVAGAIGGWEAKPLPPPVVVEKPVLVPTLDEFKYGQGWVADPDAIAVNRDPVKTLQFSRTPAGKAALGEGDALLYRAVRKAGGYAADKYPNVNQESVGCCVGCGFKHSADASLACAIAAGERFQWKPIAVEPIYAGSRVEVGGGQIRGDGSLGQWAAAWVKDKGGLVPMERFGKYDLTAFSPARARQWGARGAGVPDELEPAAREHQVKGTALVTTVAEARRAMQQGYAIAVCSNVGFDNRDGTVGTRDAQGFCSPRGTWNHCMALIGYRTGARPGFLCLNSWGDNAHGGARWPEDMPPAAFWIDEAVVGRMLSQGDSFALADVEGFPERRPLPDWFVSAPVRNPFRPFADRDAFALAW